MGISNSFVSGFISISMVTSLALKLRVASVSSLDWPLNCMLTSVVTSLPVVSPVTSKLVMPER